MTRIKWLFPLLLFPMALMAQTPGVVFSWTGNGNPSLPNCSSTVTASCVANYTLTDITAAPVVIAPNIAIGQTGYTLTPLPSVGAHTYSLITVGKDQSGTSISSAPATVTVTIPSISLNPPTGFSAIP